ncbi:hypothetical protein [Actinacidiphila guanduensis]|uniref:hypothetical protein n=1 Tax=Actinacidiphila guanduensis TaxID=310781 RepID=UPI00159FF96F|nr:hypothetical protein [Actinacidiphila guanduensis]
MPGARTAGTRARRAPVGSALSRGCFPSREQPAASGQRHGGERAPRPPGEQPVRFEPGGCRVAASRADQDVRPGRTAVPRGLIGVRHHMLVQHP